MYGRTNAGGCIDPFAFIFVTYPAGSACTCTDGSRTLKLKDTSGSGVFFPPYVGKWTVTITDPTGANKPASATAEITKEGESVSLELHYGKHFFDGKIVGETVITTPEHVSVANNLLSVTYASDNGMWMYWKEPARIDAFSTLKVVAATTSIYSYNGELYGWCGPAFCLMKNAPAITPSNPGTMTSNSDAYVQLGIDSSYKTYTVDVSKLTGEYYLGFSAIAHCSVKEILLEL